MKDTTKIALLVITGSVCLAVSATGLAHLYQKSEQKQKANSPTEINCVVVPRVYEPDELKCKLNGDIWMFTKEKQNVKAN